MNNKPCKYNGCDIGFDNREDMVSLRYYIQLLKGDTEYNKDIIEEMSLFTYCPYCGNKVKDLLQNIDKTV